MLDFYLGRGGVENLGKHIGALSSEAIYWLQQHKFIKQGTTGHLPEDCPESLPFGDDVILTDSQVQEMYKKFILRREESRRTPGFQSDNVHQLGRILDAALEGKSGLSTLAD